jgi:hypothetical protein
MVPAFTGILEFEPPALCAVDRGVGGFAVAAPSSCLLPLFALAPLVVGMVVGGNEIARLLGPQSQVELESVLY